MNFWEARQAALEGKMVRVFGVPRILYNATFFRCAVSFGRDLVEAEWEIIGEPKTKSWFVIVDTTECIGGFDSPRDFALSHRSKGNWIEIITDENGKLISAKNV